MTVDLKGVKKIEFITNPETLITVIVNGKTMKEALEKARDWYGYKGDTLDRCDAREDTRIGIMKYSDYAMRSICYFINNIG